MLNDLSSTEPLWFIHWSSLFTALGLSLPCGVLLNYSGASQFILKLLLFRWCQFPAGGIACLWSVLLILISDKWAWKIGLINTLKYWKSPTQLWAEAEILGAAQYFLKWDQSQFPEIYGMLEVQVKHLLIIMDCYLVVSVKLIHGEYEVSICRLSQICILFHKVFHKAMMIATAPSSIPALSRLLLLIKPHGHWTTWDALNINSFP